MKRLFAYAFAAAAFAAHAQDQHPQQDGMQGMDMQGMSMPADGAPPASAPAPNGHVPPPPPQHALPPMEGHAMNDMMQMNDNALLGMFKADRLEGQGGDGAHANEWEAEGWLGNDADKLWFKTEGERERDGTRDARLELLWDRPYASFWDWQLGVRDDFGRGPSRQWAAFGVQGLAPYWFELQATAYLGPDGRTAVRMEASYELLFTQRLILTPDLEANAYGKGDPRRGIGSGLSDLQFGLRLRYEFNRHVAPYVGIERSWRLGNTADASRALGEPADDTRWVAGVRIWF